MCSAEEPGDEGGMMDEGGGFLGECEEDTLGDIFGAGGVFGEAEGGGIYPVEVAGGGLAEGVGVLGLGVLAEEIGVGGFGRGGGDGGHGAPCCLYVTADGGGRRTGYFWAEFG